MAGTLSPLASASTPATASGRQGLRMLRIGVLGRPAAGKTALTSALAAHCPRHIEICDAPQAADLAGCSAILFVIDSQLPAEAQDAALAEIVGRLGQWRRERGRRMNVGAFPVFLVLSQCDRRARPGMAQSQWLEEIERLKEGVRSRLAEIAPNLAVADPGFGSIRLELAATALAQLSGRESSESVVGPFGIIELAQKATAAAESYSDRLTEQGRRTRRLAWGAAAGVTVLLAGSIFWGAHRVSRLHGGEGDPERVPAAATQLQQQSNDLLLRSRRLLAFVGFPAETEPDWAAWMRDAGRCRKELIDLAEALRSEDEAANRPIRSLLVSAAAKLAVVQKRIALFGLVPESEDRPALLRIPAAAKDEDRAAYEAIRQLARERWARLRADPELADLGPLPEELPVGIVRRLQQEAWTNREKLVRPAAAEVRRRVRELGGGRESPDAWQALAQTWLVRDAKFELNSWREMAAHLRRLAGDHDAADPVAELEAFLRRNSVLLPMETLQLEVPDVVEVRTTRGDGGVEIRSAPRLRPAGKPLVIERRPQRAQDPIDRWEWQLEPGGRSGTFRFRLSDAAGQGDVGERPLEVWYGEQLWARLEMKDEYGETWLLTWTPLDSPSPAFAFAVLALPPRIHPPTVTDPAAGTPALGVRLRFADPRPFQLPELIAPAVRR